MTIRTSTHEIDGWGFTLAGASSQPSNQHPRGWISFGEAAAAVFEKAAVNHHAKWMETAGGRRPAVSWRAVTDRSALSHPLFFMGPIGLGVQIENEGPHVAFESEDIDAVVFIHGAKIYESFRGAEFCAIVVLVVQLGYETVERIDDTLEEGHASTLAGLSVLFSSSRRIDMPVSVPRSATGRKRAGS